MCQVKLNEKMFNINNLCCMWGEEVLHFLNLQLELHKQLDRKYERSWNCNFLHHSFKLNHHQSHNWTHSSRLRSRIAGLKRRPIKINSAYPKKKDLFPEVTEGRIWRQPLQEWHCVVFWCHDNLDHGHLQRGEDQDLTLAASRLQ